jgi:branched-chain amino acid aminotransferase
MASPRPSSLPENVQIWIDGIRKVPENAHVSVLDLGFLYGDSIFETLRTYGKTPFALSEHMQRLQQSADRVLIQLPLGLDALSEEVTRAVQASPFEESYVRVMVTRGLGALGLDPRKAVQPLRVVLVAPLSAPPLADYQHGIGVVTFETSRTTDDTPAAGAKVGNYLVAVLANKKAAEAGAKEALISNARGEVTEGATSNLFWFEGRRLLTPPVSAGILDGITRRYIIEAAEVLRLELVEQIPHLDRLFASDGVFVSSSIREMLPVVTIDGKPVSGGKVPKTFTGLHAAFRRAVGVEPLRFD